MAVIIVFLFIIITHLQLIEDDPPQPRDARGDPVSNLIVKLSHFHFSKQ